MPSLLASRSRPRGSKADTVRAEGPRPSIAVIGDIVASRRVGEAQRSLVQRQLEGLVTPLNARYRRAIAARFLVTLGGEFQGVLRRGDVIPDLIWDIETGLADVDVRLGIGFGTLLPPFKTLALGMDGPAFHAARDAIELARKRRLHGGLFKGFGATDDLVLNGLARLLRQERHGLSPAPLATLALLRQGRSQAEIAKQLRLTRQAVSSRAQSARWEAFAEAQRAWRAGLTPFAVTHAWPGSR